MRAISLSILLGVLGLSFVTGCGQRDSRDSTSDTFAIGGQRLSEGQVAGYLKAAGFPQGIIPQMVCTAKWESSFYTGATNVNDNGTRDTGLFQINDVHVGSTCNVTRATLSDPLVNARCALKIYNMQGLDAWYGYQAHRRECDGYRAVTPVAASAGNAGCDQEALQTCLRFGGGNACYPRSGCTR